MKDWSYPGHAGASSSPNGDKPEVMAGIPHYPRIRGGWSRNGTFDGSNGHLGVFTDVSAGLNRNIGIGYSSVPN
ncbi:MAG: hypothetical protein JWL68_1621 [Actinomycetia bacterium]|nr:hypothetical protein [Actinomycetes bacterium]